MYPEENAFRKEGGDWEREITTRQTERKERGKCEKERESTARRTGKKGWEGIMHGRRKHSQNGVRRERERDVMRNSIHWSHLHLWKKILASSNSGWGAKRSVPCIDLGFGVSYNLLYTKWGCWKSLGLTHFFKISVSITKHQNKPNAFQYAFVYKTQCLMLFNAQNMSCFCLYQIMQTR